tara:strand:- start:1029 stop:1253 length:225 start_codon:yes stop_codon:yes gene_type:complete
LVSFRIIGEYKKMEARKQYYLLEIEVEEEELPKILEVVQGRILPESLAGRMRKIGKLNFITNGIKDKEGYVYTK